MRILAHRGLWGKENEKNTVRAISSAYQDGFGIETDLRDYEEKLVISHNVASSSAESAEEIFAERAKLHSDAFLALNIKADGIQNFVLELLRKYHIEDYAVFDMSIPEMVVYDKMEIRFFTRQSEIEKELVMYEKACGVWMDEWHTDWINKAIIESHLERGKIVGVISPEIHGRNHSVLWEKIRGIESDNLLLCTDIPLEARRYFNE